MKKNLLLAFAIGFCLTGYSQTTIFQENFEAVAIPSMPTGWNTSGQAGSDLFKTGTSSSAGSSYFPLTEHSQFAFTNDDTCNCNKAADFLVFPSIDLSSYSGAQLTFASFMVSDSTPTYLDSAYLEASTDNGTTWQKIFAVPKVQSWSNYSVSLSAYNYVSSLLLRFGYYDLGNWGYGLAVDDITILGSAPISFYQSATTGCAPATTVSFSNTTTDPNASTFYFYFGDGNSSPIVDTTHVYSTPGYYTPYMAVWDASGNFLGTYQGNQIIIEGPTPINSSVDSACPGDLISFSNYNSIGTTWNWDFGDGNDALNQQYTSHSFSAIGSYSVTVYVNTSICGTISSTKNIIISGSVPASPILFSHYPNPVCPNTAIYHYPSSNAASYQWDFGDGFTSIQPNAEHIYTSPGTYAVTLTTTNNCGTSASYTDTCYIVSSMPFPDMGIDFDTDSACPNSNINMWAPSNGLAYVYDFGDNSPADSNSSYYRSHIYTALGNYTVSVKMYDGCGNDTTYTATVSIVNNLGFLSGLSASNNSPACPGSTIVIYGPGGYSSYVWDFGDGTSITTGENESNGQHLYQNLGTYNASVRIFNSCGKDTTLYTTVNISNNEPINSNVYLNAPSTACPGESVGLYVPNFNFTYFVWNYGDGSATDSLSASNGGYSRNHIYGSVGIYTASVTIYNSCGSDTTLFGTIDINANSPFQNSVYFNQWPNEICPNDIVNFNAEQGYISYAWDFGDGSPVITTSNSNAEHQYSAVGTYYTSVIIRNLCGNDTTLYDSLVVGTSVSFPSWTQLYLSNTQVCPGQYVTVYTNYSNAASYEWNFGNGNIFTTTNNSYEIAFTSEGTIVFSLKITNNCGNDTTLTDSVTVSYPAFSATGININASPACPGQSVGFNVQNGYYKYLWNFGDGSPLFVNYYNGGTMHTFGDTGYYPVSVKIFQNCGIDPYQFPNVYKDTTIYDTVIVSINTSFNQNIGFNANQGSCSDEFNFQASNGFASYSWDFGDGNTDSTSSWNASYTYSDTGTYQVALTVTNFCGQDSTVYASVSVNQLQHGRFLPECFTCDSTYSNPDVQYLMILPTRTNVGGNMYNISNSITFSACPGETIYLNLFAWRQNSGGYFSDLNYYVSQNTETVIWNYWDGSPSDTFPVSYGSNGIYTTHIFNTQGTDTFSVKLIHRCGNDTTIYGIINIDTTLGFPDNVVVDVYNQNPCVGQATAFNAPLGYQSYQWSFGDSTAIVDSGNFIFHYYPTVGTYTASATITNYCGNDTVIYRTVQVVDYKPFPTYSYLDMSQNNLCPGENVWFNVEAGWENVSYHWDYGDGDTITNYSENNGSGQGAYSNHSYDSVGTYQVAVTITNTCGNDTTLTASVNVVGYKAFPGWLSINAGPNPACPGDNVSFNVNSGYASYQWDFGDGTTGQNYPYVNHKYDSLGSYTALLTLTNFCGNDTTLTKTININGNIEFGPYTSNGQNWDLYNWPNVACPGQGVQFQGPNGLPYYVWDFGDGTIDSTSNYYYTGHQFDTAGAYTIALTMINNCGYDTTIYTQVNISNNAGFSNLYMNFNSSSVCPGQEVSINGPYGYAGYVYDFGDGSPVDSSEDESVRHAYQNAGTYNVGLTVYNYCGEDTTIYAPVVIDSSLVFNYAPSVDAYPTNVCPGQEVNFYSEYGHQSYLWDFNDGFVAQGYSSVSHSFDTLGTYQVKVLITNFCGSDTTVGVNVTVSDTISTFANLDLSVNPPVSCPGDMVEFYADGAFSLFQWTFGDGDTLTSNGNKVEHIYNASGAYNVSVKVTNGCGYSTTIYESVSINSNAPIDTALSVFIPFNPNCPGDEVFFNIERGASTYIYNWNFADGSSDSTVGTGTSHVFSDSGTYAVNITATNGCGNSKTVTVNAEINNSVLPVMDDETFGVGTGGGGGPAGCPDDAILFWFAGTYDNVWDFGDGSTGIATEQVMTDMGLPITVAKHIYDSAGTYTASLTLINNCGNSITKTVVVEITENLLVNGDIFIAAPTGTSGYTTCTSIDMIGIGGAKYSWDFGDGDTITTVSPTISHTYSNPGTYTVSVKVINGCGFSTTYFSTITVNGIGGPSASVAGIESSCYGSTDGSATVSVTDGIAPFTYQWDFNAGNQAGITATGLAAGTYSVNIIDALGCSSIETVIITQPTDITITSATTSSTCGASDGSASVLLSGGAGGPYTYSWSGGSTDSVATGLAAGNYVVSVTNANGCQKVGNISVNNGNAALANINTITNISCYGGSDGSVDITVSGGTSPYTYLWSDSTQTEDLTGKTAGTYSLTITDANNCISGQSVTLTQPNDLTLYTVVVNANCGTSNGSATVNANGGTATYAYQWDDNAENQTTATATGLPAGQFLVIVTDAKGCADSIVAVVSNANAPVITATITNVSCFGASDGAINQSVTGGTIPYTYIWSGLSQATKNVSGLSPGIYTVMIEDASDCKSIRNYTVTQPNVLVASASSVAATCGNADGTATVSHTGGNTSFTYLWDNSQASSTATGLAAGNYIVTVTDNRGCSDTAAVIVSQPATFVSSSTADSTACFNGIDGSASAITNGGNAPYSYAWSTGDTTAAISSLSAGIYSYSITDVNGCTSNGTATVNQPEALTATTSANTPSCVGSADGTASIFASGGYSPYTYDWSNSGTSSTEDSLTAGTYYLTITDANGCTLQDTVIISDPVALSAGFSVTDAACFGNSNGSVSATASGGASPYSYLWSNSDSTNLSGNLPSGNYVITITDANGCSMVDSAEVTEPAQLNATILIVDASCFTSCNGSATVFPAGGTSPYTYLWNNGDNGATADSLCAGSYSVNISDANNCQASQNATIAEPDLLTVSLSVTGTTCGNSDGSATASAGGGTTPYSFTWSSGSQTDSIATGLGTGAVSVTVTDLNNCQAFDSDTVGLFVPPLDVCIVTVDNSSTKNLVVWEKPAVTYIDSFRIYRDIVGTYTYIGSVDYLDLSKFVDTTNGINPNITSYKYKVSVLDNCGNESALSDFHKTMHLQTIFQSGEVDLSWDNYDGFGTGFYYRILRDSTQTGNWQVLDSVSYGNTQYTDLNPPAGLVNYTMEVVHPFGGCLATKSVENHNSSRSNRGQSANAAPLSAVSTSTDATQGNCDGTATVTASGGIPPYSYQWDNNAGSQTLETATGLCAGNYSVTVTDSYGNNASSTVTVLTSGSTLSATATSTNASAGNCDGTATVSVSGGTSPYSYEWSANASGQITATITGLCAGTYSVTVTDDDGNTFVTNAVVSITGSTLGANATATSTTDTVNCNGTANVIASGGTSPYAYLWSDGQTTQTATGLCGGDYSVSVTDGDTNTVVANATVGVDVQISLPDLSANNSFSIYPNPNKGEFFIQSSHYVLGAITIYNVLGELIYQAHVNDRACKLSINFNERGSGLYYVQLTGEYGIVKKKIIVE